jgi:anthranilate/para-aminobenzoate synthase component II
MAYSIFVYRRESMVTAKVRVGLEVRKLSPTLARLEEYAAYCAKELAFPEGSAITVTVQTVNPKKGCEQFHPESWVRKGDGSLCGEITISAQALRLPAIEIAGIVYHAVLHARNWYTGVRDVSREGRYHSQEWRETATRAGMDVSKSETSGWSETTLSPGLEAKFLVELGPKDDDFTHFRLDPVKPEAKTRKSQVKWSCSLGCKTFWASASVESDPQNIEDGGTWCHHPGHGGSPCQILPVVSLDA